MSFLYFVERLDKEILDELTYAFKGQPQRRDIFADGPSGNKGFVLFDNDTWNSCIQKVGVFEGKQTWRKIPHLEAWLGWYPDESADVEKLRAETYVEGERIRLGDDQQWTIPLVRCMEDGYWRTTLPRTNTLNEDGMWQVGDVITPYRSLNDLCDDLFQKLIEAAEEENKDSGFTMTIADEIGWCVEPLATNYRIRELEISVLELLNDTTRPEILRAMLGLAKKN